MSSFWHPLFSFVSASALVLLALATAATAQTTTTADIADAISPALLMEAAKEVAAAAATTTTTASMEQKEDNSKERIVKDYLHSLYRAKRSAEADLLLDQVTKRPSQSKDLYRLLRTLRSDPGLARMQQQRLRKLRRQQQQQQSLKRQQQHQPQEESGELDLTWPRPINNNDNDVPGRPTETALKKALLHHMITPLMFYRNLVYAHNPAAV